jgi:hypothetical protein
MSRLSNEGFIAPTRYKVFPARLLLLPDFDPVSRALPVELRIHLAACPAQFQESPYVNVFLWVGPFAMQPGRLTASAEGRSLCALFLFVTNTLSRPDRRCGFVIRVSRQVPLSNEAAFLGFYDSRLRDKWLEADVTIRKAFATSLVQCNWIDGAPTLDIRFRPITGRETEIEVEHRRLPSKQEALRMRDFWASALERLELKLVPKR